MKLIEIIPIAYKKMERRGIAENWVRDVINYPDQIVSGYEGCPQADRDKQEEIFAPSRV